MSAVPQTTAVVADSRQVLEHHARSFTWGSWFLPVQQRDDAAVLYALCRLADDLADEADDPRDAEASLLRLEAELRGEAKPRPLVARYLASPCGARPDAILALIDGVRSDLSFRPSRDDRDLLRYCYAVAGTVGLAMLPVIGVRDPAATAHAIDLGVAMQLTNICRDVFEDASEMQRVYLPASRLQAHGVRTDDLLEGRADAAGTAAVVTDLLDLADRYYASADAGMRFIPLRTRAAIVVIRHVYAAIGHKLRRNGSDALAGRTIVSPLGKAFAVSKALVSLFAGVVVDSLSAPVAHDRILHSHLSGLPGIEV